MQTVREDPPVSDPQNPPPDVPPQPAYGAPPPASYPPADQPYTAPPPQYPATPTGDTYPGKTMGIVAFVVSLAGLIFWVIAPLVGLVLGIVAMVQSRKAGRKNGFALAAIIISAVLIVIGIIMSIFIIGIVVAATSEIARLCAEYGTGVHEINGVTVTLNCG